ncbi:hypothetical protein [Luteococcus sp.]|uniref:hypothetical protein n=1 Tax=Luteococcus sp. TaxID=1969402 RepID=UPI003736D1D7
MSPWPNHIRHINPDRLPSPVHDWEDVLTTYPNIAYDCSSTIATVAKSPVNEPNESGLRAFLEDRFPDMSAIVAEYKRIASPHMLRVPSETPTGHFVGTAFGLVTTALTCPDGFRDEARSLVFRLRTPNTRRFASFIERLDPATATEPDFLRACLGLARLVDRRHASSPHADPRLSELPRSPRTLLDLGTAQELAELSALVAIAQEDFVPTIAACGTVAANVFDFPKPLNNPLTCLASLDLLADRTLVEIKTNGPRRPGGPSVLKKEAVAQLIGYILRDYDDRFEFERVLLYQGRYGVTVTWDVDRLLDTAAGHRVDLARTRDDFRRLLEATAGPRPTDWWRFRVSA